MTYFCRPTIDMDNLPGPAVLREHGWSEKKIKELLIWDSASGRWVRRGVA